MVCYLCGELIANDPSRDHVPPQQLWSPEIRREFNISRLTTLPTHRACNQLYKLDEEYAFRALATTAYDKSLTARSLVRHGFRKAAAGSGMGLHRKLLAAMAARPSGLVLPDDQVVLRVEGARIKRVVWKVVRGLWYLEHQSVLPETTPYLYEIREPDNRALAEFEEFWQMVRAQPSRGEYQALFAFKYLRFEQDGETLHGWAMLLWNRVIIYCMHFDPNDAPDFRASGPRSGASLPAP